MFWISVYLAHKWNQIASDLVCGGGTAGKDLIKPGSLTLSPSCKWLTLSFLSLINHYHKVYFMSEGVDLKTQAGRNFTNANVVDNSHCRCSLQSRINLMFGCASLSYPHKYSPKLLVNIRFGCNYHRFEDRALLYGLAFSYQCSKMSQAEIHRNKDTIVSCQRNQQDTGIFN